jgi:hypothetical protein
MAGDWIKMRIDLQSHPKVVRILSATKSDKFRAIGGLHAVWSVFDTHSVDGALYGYTPETLDHIIGWQGLSQAMIAVGWMEFDGVETLVLPEFDEHNGKSAKRRAEDQKRKRNDRNCPQSVRNLSADEPDEKQDEKRTREEKRRINNKTPEYSGEFLRFWAAYPNCKRKGGRPDAYKTWLKLDLDAKVELILPHIAETVAPREDQFIAEPSAYLNKQGWDGWEPSAPKKRELSL